jgi:hypothetical protein
MCMDISAHNDHLGRIRRDRTGEGIRPAESGTCQEVKIRPAQTPKNPTEDKLNNTYLINLTQVDRSSNGREWFQQFSITKALSTTAEISGCCTKVG